MWRYLPWSAKRALRGSRRK
jgi:uncharacterized protein (TIGR02271 family)